MQRAEPYEFTNAGFPGPPWHGTGSPGAGMTDGRVEWDVLAMIWSAFARMAAAITLGLQGSGGRPDGRDWGGRRSPRSA
jgi:hypothetical protein